MRKIINSTDTSLDGVVEKHLWPRIKRPDNEGRRDQIQTDLLLACDAVLMGVAPTTYSRRRGRRAAATPWPTA
jgi:hypothetical protein